MPRGPIMMRHYAADGGLGSPGTDGKFSCSSQLDELEENIPSVPLIPLVQTRTLENHKDAAPTATRTMHGPASCV
jgi:hypothetical protein